MLKTIFKILKTLVKLAFTMLCVLLVAIILIQRFSNNQITVMGFRIFNVATGSMIPKYNIGDVLVVKSVDTETIQVGEDITYMGEKDSFAGKIVTHQVIEIENVNGQKIFHTKGIANPDEDPPITANQIFGKVLCKLKIITYFSSIANNMYGMYILLIGSIAFVMILEIRDYRSMNKEEKENKNDSETNKEKNIDNSDTEIKQRKTVNKMRERRRKRQQKIEERE